jgi:dTDP-4-amino-4,6-dideoxygalactose transaminase
MSINVTRSSMPDFEEYVNEIRDLWDSRWLTNMGEKHIEFEAKLREYLGVSYLTLFTNGHMALEDLIASFGFPKGGEVITTPFTFVSTTHAIVRNGLVPVFCDIDPGDFTLDETKIEALITDRTVATLPVHVYGNDCHVEEIAKVAARHRGNAAGYAAETGGAAPGTDYNGDIKVIYDAAHTFGVRRKDPVTGQFRAAADYGDAAILSFHATKVFHTIEGGAAVCHDDRTREILDDLKNFGIRNPETCAYIGGNAKMSEFQAAMGICNLRHIDEEIGKRSKVYGHYKALIGDEERIRFPVPDKDIQPNYAYLPVLFETQETRDRVWDALKAEGITARKYFWPLTSDYECYGYLRSGNGTPVARDTASRVLTLPMYADLAADDIDRICGIVRKAVQSD